jgi:hypothetical protein
MAFVNHPMEEEEKPLWYYASPQLDDIKVEKSDLILEATEYKIKPRMIEMVEANQFRGVKMDNPYRHVERFMMLCNTVQQRVPVNWYEWNLFHTHLRIEQNDGTHLHPSRWKEIGIDW